MSRDKLREIADAIRTQEGSSDPIPANQFATRIGALPNGKYKLEVVDEEDGTQSWHLVDWDYVPAPSFDPVFANNTWTQIAQASEIIKANNYTSAQVKEVFGWDLQTDTKADVGKDGVCRIFHFNGFNHDDLSDGSGKAGITLGMVDCEPIKYTMNSTATNEGGYPATAFRNETVPTIKALLSDELQSVIKKVDKKSANGGSTNYTEIVTTSEDIFLYSEIELFGLITNSQEGENEGSVYEYWNGKTNTDRIKMYDEDVDGEPEKTVLYYLRSSSNRTTQSFCMVTLAGSSHYCAANINRAISYALCI